MGKRKKKIIVFLCFTLICIPCLKINALADGYVCEHGYHTFGDHTLNGGVGNYGYTRRYYWQYNLVGIYNDFLTDAVSDWVNTDVYTSISIRETGNQPDSSFDVYDSYLGTNVLGRTVFWTGETQVGLNSDGSLTNNYGWTQVHINTTALNNEDFAISNSQKQATIAHEFGHAMGLSHQNSNPSSIMCQTAYNRYATKPSSEDLYAINHLYD